MNNMNNSKQAQQKKYTEREISSILVTFGNSIQRLLHWSTDYIELVHEDQVELDELNDAHRCIHKDNMKMLRILCETLFVRIDNTVDPLEKDFTDEVEVHPNKYLLTGRDYPIADSKDCGERYPSYPTATKSAEELLAESKKANAEIKAARQSNNKTDASSTASINKGEETISTNTNTEEKTMYTVNNLVLQTTEAYANRIITILNFSDFKDEEALDKTFPFVTSYDSELIHSEESYKSTSSDVHRAYRRRVFGEALTKAGEGVNNVYKSALQASVESATLYAEATAVLNQMHKAAIAKIFHVRKAAQSNTQTDASSTASINKCEENVPVANETVEEIPAVQETTPPVSSDKTETIVNNINTIPLEENSMYNTNNIINFGQIAASAVNFNGKGTNFAEVLANVIYAETPAFVPFANDSAEVRANAQAKVDAANAVAATKRAAFVAQYSNVLGSIAPTTLNVGKNAIFNKTSQAVKAAVSNFFNIAEVEVELAGDSAGFQVDTVNAALLVFATIAAATVRLTAVERAAILATVAGVEAKGSIVTVNDVVIDLAAATVAQGSFVQTANSFSCFGQEQIAVEYDTDSKTWITEDTFVVLDGAHSVFMLALSALKGTDKQIGGALAGAVKLFAPVHNYGHKPDADDISFHVDANLVYANTIIPANTSFPAFSISRGKQHPDFLSYVLGCGVIAASDKTNIKFVTLGAGAEAIGIGWNREAGVIQTVNDVAKPSKLINRGAANAYDCADQTDRVASNFGFQLSNGEVARTKGRMMTVAYSNSILLTSGSGVATVHPSVSFDYTVDKNLKFALQFSALGAQYVNNEAEQNATISGMMKAFAAKKGQVFAPGEAILSFGSTILAANTETVASVEFLYASVKRNVLDNNEVDIIAHVRLLGTSQFVKTRRFATKFTTLPYNVQGLSKEWEIILNNECTKGQGALLEMFANETGERYMNNNTGEFVTPGGNVINLLDADNAFQAWKEASTVVETISVVMAKSAFNNIKEFGGSEFTVVSEDATTVTVQETVSVIYGSLVFDVEISTPLESVSTSSMTLESAAAVYLQSRRLGETLLQQVNDQTDAYVALATSFANMQEPNLVVNLQDAESYESFLGQIENLTVGTNHKELLSALEGVFPSGIKFAVGVSNFTVHFGAVRTFGSFNPLNGGASREAAQVINFLVDVLDNGAENALSLIVNAARAFAKILDTAVSSKNVLKKPTRSGRLVYGKVRTSTHPILHTNDGIPSVVVNANCPIVGMLRAKEGDFVGFARTPMPFLGAGRLVLTNDSSICDVAHVLVDPFVWHSLCEGDSDGDGIALLNLSKGATKISKKEAIEINASKMGIGGYRYLYGANVPFADFMSVSDKHSKKNPAAKVAMVSCSIKNPDSAKQELIALTPAVLGDFASRVANHYKSAVGVGYGICSKLVFNAADVAAKGESKELNTLVDACLVAWRQLYEGLGLSGYSREASKVYGILNAASVDTKLFQVAKVGPEAYDVIFKDDTWKSTRDNCVDGAEVLAACFPGVNVSTATFKAIIMARTVTRVVAKLEGFGKAPTQWWDEVVPATIKYGTLRRISQGDDRVAELLDDQEIAELVSDEAFVALPLTRKFVAANTVASFHNVLLGNAVQKIAQFHVAITATKAANKYN